MTNKQGSPNLAASKLLKLLRRYSRAAIRVVQRARAHATTQQALITGIEIPARIASALSRVFALAERDRQGRRWRKTAQGWKAPRYDA